MSRSLECGVRKLGVVSLVARRIGKRDQPVVPGIGCVEAFLDGVEDDQVGVGQDPDRRLAKRPLAFGTGASQETKMRE